MRVCRDHVHLGLPDLGKLRRRHPVDAVHYGWDATYEKFEGIETLSRQRGMEIQAQAGSQEIQIALILGGRLPPLCIVFSLLPGNAEDTVGVAPVSDLTQTVDRRPNKCIIQ